MRARQRGVAVVTALLLTTLAVTIVASLFWRQQIAIRALENQRLQLQTQWVLRGTVDWARRVLREDARLSNVDHLGEDWAKPLPATKLDNYVDNGRAETDASVASASGAIVDAQSFYNLSNLAQNAIPNPKEVQVFQRLLAILQIDPKLAPGLALALAATQSGAAPAGATEGAPPQQAPLAHDDDLLSVPGFSREVIDKLKDFVVVLPTPTAINVNTAGPEVLAARMGKSTTEVAALIASRGQAYFRDDGDFENRAHGALVPGELELQSHYFLVNGKVRIERAGLEMQALIYRKNTGNTTVKWLREY
ncbi:general secretion pathway protein K [Oxalobacteraceae bacterium GrIS 1.11]